MALIAPTIVCLSPLFVAHVVGHAAATLCPPINGKTQLPARLSYVVPSGFADISRAGDSEAYLVAPPNSNALQSISFVPDDPPTDVTGHTATTVAGLPSFVVTDVALGGQFGTFERDVVLQCGQGIQFRVDCRGLPGYDPTLIGDGCQRFIASLTFPPDVAVGGRACPSIAAARGDLTTIACSLPDGYHVVPPKLTDGIALAAPGADATQARIDLTVSPPTTTRDYAGHTRITVGDCPAYVMTNTSTTTAYVLQAVVDCGTSPRYSVQCRGYQGSDPSPVAESCASFLASLHTVSVPQSSQGSAAVGAVPGSVGGVPLGAVLVTGVFTFAIIRFASWEWPQVFGRDLLLLIWSTALGRTLFLVVVGLSAACIATQFPTLGNLAMAFWTVVVVAFALEVLYRTAGRRFMFAAERGQAVPAPAPPQLVVEAPASAPASTPQSAVGYGRRSQAPGPITPTSSLLDPRPSPRFRGRPRGPHGPVPPVRASAWMLHAQPGAQLSHQVPYGSPGGYAFAQQRCEPSALRRLLQTLAVVQGVLGVLGGVNVLRSELALRALSSVGAPTGVTGDLKTIGIATIVLSSLVIIAAIGLGRPSPSARLFLVLWEVAATVATVGILLKFAILPGLRDAYIVVVSAAGMDFVHPVLALTIALITLAGVLDRRRDREELPQ